MRWKMLPGSLDPDWRQLVVRLRELKDHAGLSLQSLQAKTPFSGSSWERYLNGKALPPESAIEALAHLTGADPAPLLALRAAAGSTAESGAAALAADGAEETEPEHGAGVPETPVVALSLAAGALLLSAVASVVLIVDPWHPNVPVGSRGSPDGPGKYTCTYTRRGDLTFAGNSTTSSRLVMRNTTGPDAAEVQCLLLRHQLSPGDVDGYYGPLTEKRVKSLQRRDHVAADGIVGEQTWALLRRVG
ncbi:helix-turn-helix domain-containing protein [Streptomyces sioyaensis]|uniref:helix-turn-helix domain-containing protein n=1 Tax=Streptomyces sioyaensis TaxID=67364 RepID=UPI0037197F43